MRKQKTKNKTFITIEIKEEKVQIFKYKVYNMAFTLVTFLYFLFL